MIGAAATGAVAGRAGAQQPVGLALVLAVDASGSVDQRRFELQKQGYAAAFRHPRVLRAIRSSLVHGVAVCMMQWTGPGMQVQVVDWTLVEDEASAARLADAIDNNAARRLFGGGTSVSGAIDGALSLLERSPYIATRNVIDISGDGANNRGRPAIAARDDAVRRGASINGLPILAVEPDLDIYYRENVIGGPGAFMIVASSYEDFSSAILTKLVTEIVDLGAAPVA